MPTAAFVTLGCKINQYETEAIREEVLALGYAEAPPAAPADVYVINTCAVTATSGAKSRKHVLRAARANPGSRIVVVGCSTPSEREELARIPQVAVLAGNEEKAMVASFLEGGWKPGEPFPERERDVMSLRIGTYAHRTRANVKVQDGCDSFCSFCIIPFLRGRSTSRDPGAVVEEVRRLAAGGYREVVIAGVHLQGYGAGLAPPVSLAGLLRRVAAVPGLARVRLSSISPRAFTPELIECLEAPVFCPHWHIPLQSGSDAVLRRMRRDYATDDFRRLVAELRRRFREPSIATDIIAGHPGETPADFERTLDLCREMGFSKIHVFPYSLREGTLAAKLGGHVEPAEVQRRARRLRELEAELALAYRRRFLGEVAEVLVEGPAAASGEAEVEGAPGGRADGEGGAEGGAAPGAGETGGSPRPPDGWLEGLTERYVRVRFRAPSPRAGERFPGTFQSVRLTTAEPAAARGVWAGELRS